VPGTRSDRARYQIPDRARYQIPDRARYQIVPGKNVPLLQVCWGRRGGGERKVIPVYICRFSLVSFDRVFG
jgi:hypothetical protein